MFQKNANCETSRNLEMICKTKKKLKQIETTKGSHSEWSKGMWVREPIQSPVQLTKQLRPTIESISSFFLRHILAVIARSVLYQPLAIGLFLPLCFAFLLKFMLFSCSIPFSLFLNIGPRSTVRYRNEDRWYTM